jgi:hypothetical protein
LKTRFELILEQSDQISEPSNPSESAASTPADSSMEISAPAATAHSDQTSDANQGSSSIPIVESNPSTAAPVAMPAQNADPKSAESGSQGCDDSEEDDDDEEDEEESDDDDDSYYSASPQTTSPENRCEMIVFLCA